MPLVQRGEAIIHFRGVAEHVTLASLARVWPHKALSHEPSVSPGSGGVYIRMRQSLPLSCFLGHWQADMISCPFPCRGVNGGSFSFSQREKQPGKGREWPQCPHLWGPCFVLSASCAQPQSSRPGPGSVSIPTWLMKSLKPEEVKDMLRASPDFSPVSLNGPAVSCF